jgi:protein NirF
MPAPAHAVARHGRPRPGHRARQRPCHAGQYHQPLEAYARIGGLGDLSHASVVYSRDARYAYVFGRDGGLTKIDLLEARIVKRVMQSGNAIGGSISQDGRIVVAQNYTPGGIKAFDADTLELLAEVPAEYAPGQVLQGGRPGRRAGQQVRLRPVRRRRDLGQRFFRSEAAGDASAIPAGQQPYDGLVTPDGRHYLAGLFGEDGIALLDLWQPEKGARKILEKYGKGEEKLPVFKMPHLRGWSVAAGRAWLPAIGRHEVLVADAATWKETGRVAVKGQPVFVMASPDGRQIWVNFAFPDNGWVQVIDTLSGQVVQTLQPGKAVLHMEFTPRGEAVWLSARDDNRVVIYDTKHLPQSRQPSRRGALRHLLHQPRGAHRILSMDSPYTPLEFAAQRLAA